MGRANDIVIERQALANNYNKVLKDRNFFQLPYNEINYEHGYQSYPCIFDINKANIDNIDVVNQNRNAFMDNLQNDGVSTRPATHAVHMLQYYREKYKLNPEDFPNAFIANNCSISFPLFNGITQREQDYVIKTIAKYL